MSSLGASAGKTVEKLFRSLTVTQGGVALRRPRKLGHLYEIAGAADAGITAAGGRHHRRVRRSAQFLPDAVDARADSRHSRRHHARERHPKVAAAQELGAGRKPQRGVVCRSRTRRGSLPQQSGQSLAGPRACGRGAAAARRWLERSVGRTVSSPGRSGLFRGAVVSRPERSRAGGAPARRGRAAKPRAAPGAGTGEREAPPVNRACAPARGRRCDRGAVLPRRPQESADYPGNGRVSAAVDRESGRAGAAEGSRGARGEAARIRSLRRRRRRRRLVSSS